MTYWNSTGKYQTESDTLAKEIPSSGKAPELHIDLVRNVTNLYHDHFNNGNCNWGSKSEQFANIEHNASELDVAANAEGVFILELLADIRKPLDADHRDDTFHHSESDSNLTANWEKLADIIISWAWDVEQGE